MSFALGTTTGAGTITIVANSALVTGIGTAFVAANIGSILVVGSQWGIIATVTSTTSITLDRPFTTAVTASAYTRSANIPVITQSGTDTDLSGLTGVPGVTVSPSSILTSAGTVSVAAGGNTVTGVGTSFSAGQVGSTFTVGAQFGIISAFTSTTSITLDRVFATAVSGATYTITATSFVWTLTSAVLSVTGNLTYNRLFNRLRFLNSANANSSTVSALSVSGTFNNSAIQTINSYSFHSPNYAFLFEYTHVLGSSVGAFIGTTAASTSTFEGNIEFNLTTGSVPLTFILEGNTTLQNGAFINATINSFNVQFTTQLTPSTLTVNNWAGYGCGMRILGNTTNINNYLSVGAAGAVNQASSAAVNNPIYVGLQDLGNNPGWRTVNNSLKYFQLLNFSSNKSSLVGLGTGNATANSQTLLVNSLTVTAQDASGVVQNMKLWAQDSNNGNRCSANYGAGLAFEIATTGNLTYTGITNSSGIATFSSIISAIFWQVASGVSANYNVDHRGNDGSTSQNLTFFACSYLHNLASQTPDMWALNTSTNLYNSIAAKTATYPLLLDASITQSTIATVAAYTSIDTAQQFYDYAKYYLYTNFAGQTATYVTRASNTINAGSYNVVIDATAASVFVLSGSTLTAKSSTFTGSLTTSGAITLANGAVFSNNTVTGNVSQATPTNLTGVAIVGNLTYNTNTPITITLTNSSVSGTVRNSGSGLVTISLTNSTIGTVGTNIVSRLTTSLNINGLTVGSQIYVANGSGTQVAYVASSSTSYTLDTTGFTGTWSYKVARYGYTSQSGTHSPATASTTVTVTLLSDLFITEPNASVVAAYEYLPDNDKLYDYSAFYETTNEGIKYSRVITKAGTSPSAGSYPVTLNDTGDLWIFNGSSLSFFAGFSLSAGVTITGPLYTSSTVTIPSNLSNTSITANVLQGNPTDLSGVTITGNLTYSTSAPFPANITMTNCVITGTVSNSGSTDVTITKVNTTIGAIGAHVTAQQFATISAPNLLSGSRVRVYDDTHGIELYNGILASAGFSQSFVYNGDATVTLTATYTNGATAKLGVSATGIFTATGVSFLNTQADDTVYNSYALNGSTITGFTADYAQSDVNLTTASNFTGASLYAWWIYNTTTEDGIRNFFGGVTALDIANLEINVPIVNLFLDNSTSTFVYQTDTIRIFRSDGAYPAKTVTTGGGGISVNWNSNVYVGTAEIWNTQTSSYTTAGTMGNALGTTLKLPEFIALQNP